MFGRIPHVLFGQVNDSVLCAVVGEAVAFVVVVVAVVVVFFLFGVFRLHRACNRGRNCYGCGRGYGGFRVHRVMVVVVVTAVFACIVLCLWSQF